jgi:3-oxoacyl-[acyl-carrier-protein] synthase II
MRAFIQSSGVISPQPTHNTTGFPDQLHEVVTNRLECIEPEYRELINPLLLRRMPRILKMGLAASQLCISRSGGVHPDGIIVGTGLGCLDNLEKFLMDVIDNQEQIKSVLPFINSTHNAVAAHISMLLKNYNYNITYCHRGFSFESALEDAMMLINEKHAQHVLVGGIDECTEDYILLHSYLNRWKQPVHNIDLLAHPSPGTIAGEGSAFFMLAAESDSPENSAYIEDVGTFLMPSGSHTNEIAAEIEQFLTNAGTTLNSLDTILLGLNGNSLQDPIYHKLVEHSFANISTLCYKHLCGEYYTSSAFALWLGSVIMENQHIPEAIKWQGEHPQQIKQLLIYNITNGNEHSLILLKYGRL